MPYARISITLPHELLKAADRRARELDRPRSWLVAEAIRRYLVPPTAGVVREPVPAPYGAPGLGESRLAQLTADLALTPEQRVLAAARTAKVAEHLRPPLAAHRLVQFDRYEDYLEWKRREDVR